jgi:hypothetical protein
MFEFERWNWLVSLDDGMHAGGDDRCGGVWERFWGVCRCREAWIIILPLLRSGSVSCHGWKTSFLLSFLREESGKGSLLDDDDRKIKVVVSLTTLLHFLTRTCCHNAEA